jgi:hypothetical protein
VSGWQDRRASPLDQARREDIAERINRYIKKHPDCTANQFQAAIGGNRGNLLQAVRDLITAGLIVRTRDSRDGRIIRYAPAEGYEPPPEPKRCAQCKRPLPPYRQRFCSDLCCIRHKKKERGIQNHDYAAWVAQTITRMGIRAIGDLEAVAQLDAMTGVISRALEVAVEGCRAQGHSDAEIGQVLGITRQAVWKRFPRQPKVGGSNNRGDTTMNDDALGLG